jgi:hypothetical protein
MPKGIVTETKHLETCPAPECNLSSKEVEHFVEELDDYTKLLEPAFRRPELKGPVRNLSERTAGRHSTQDCGTNGP